MKLKRKLQQYSDEEKEIDYEKSGLATKEERLNVYSCAFCEFVQNNLDESDPAFEAKYLFHLSSVHGLEK